jgi:hypothetical protein
MSRQQGEGDQRALHRRPNALLEEGQRQVTVVVVMEVEVQVVDLQPHREARRDPRGLDKAATNIQLRTMRHEQDQQKNEVLLVGQRRKRRRRNHQVS